MTPSDRVGPRLALLIAFAAPALGGCRAKDPPPEPPALVIGDVPIDRAIFAVERPLAPKIAICGQCHGPNGAGDADFGPDADWGTPALRGLTAAYIAEQTRAYAEGTRSHAEMSAVAKLLAPSDVEAIAKHYAALPAPAPGAAPASDRFDAALLARGAEIATRGVPAAGVAACVTCHGAQGEGVGVFPRLAGQIARYTQAQLDAFARGTRKTPQAALMAPAAKLSAEDARAVAAYYEALGPPRAPKPAE